MPGWPSPTRSWTSAPSWGPGWCWARRLPGTVAHTRPVRLVGHRHHPELAERSPLPAAATVEVPAGVQAGHRAAFADGRGIPARRPVGPGPPLRRAMPYPAASPRCSTTASCRRRPRPADRGPATRAARANRARLDELIAGNDEHQAMVAPARGAGRPGRPPRPRLTAPPATSWPPSSSGSSASRTDAAGLDHAVDVVTRVPPCASTVASDATCARRRGRGEAEDAGYDGVWTAETGHDPFFPLLLAAEHTERPRARHRHRGGVRPQPDDLAQHANDLQGLGGRFILGLGIADQAAHHEAVLDAVVAPGRPHARVHPGHAGHLGLLERRHQLDFQGDFYTHTLMTPFFNPGPNPHGAPKVFLAGGRRADDRGGRRGRRRHPRATASPPSATCAR